MLWICRDCKYESKTTYGEIPVICKCRGHNFDLVKSHKGSESRYYFQSHVQDWKNASNRTHHRYSFRDDLRGACPALDVKSNKDVAKVLKEEGVILKETVTKSAPESLWIYFSTKKDTEKFINNLNKFILER